MDRFFIKAAIFYPLHQILRFQTFLQKVHAFPPEIANTDESGYKIMAMKNDMAMTAKSRNGAGFDPAKACCKAIFVKWS